MHKIIATLAAVACLAALSGCNTVQGFGKDVEKTGDGIQNASKKVQS